MKFSVAGVCSEICSSFAALVLNGPDLLIRHVSSISAYLVLLIAYARALHMEQHCKWIVYGSDGLGGKGCTRMRPEVAPARSSKGTISESLVSWHSS
jgi:hypothetical protein